jgi:hypothetical protein
MVNKGDNVSICSVSPGEIQMQVNDRQEEDSFRWTVAITQSDPKQKIPRAKYRTQLRAV